MKHLLTILLMLLALTSKAQTVSYIYKPFSSQGCTMKYSISKQDSLYYIVVTVKSDNLMFLKEPTMMIRTFNDDLIIFHGALIDNSTQSVGVMSGNIVIPVTKVSSTAQFIISPAHLELLKAGVSKIRLSTTPIAHKRSFKKDKIGKKIYELYLKEKNKDDDF